MFQNLRAKCARVLGAPAANRNRTKRASSQFVPAVESLESRRLLATLGTIVFQPVVIGPVLENPNTEPLPIELNAATGKLYLSGDGGVNNASVSIDNRGTVNSLDDEVVTSITRGGQTYVERFARSAVDEVIFNGYAGADRFFNYTDIESEAYGGLGDDTLSGGTAHDMLIGDAGNDFLYGGWGNDFLSGGHDHDYVHGGEGSDVVNGDAGNDTLYDYAFSYADTNIIDGGYGHDSISGFGDASGGEIAGGPGNDTISAFGRAAVFGGDGDDRIYGTSLSDMIYGQFGHDWIYAGAGNDYVQAGSGNDLVYGGSGHDSLLGHYGEDWLYGEAGNDFVYGGDGDDPVISGGDGDDWLFGGDGSDSINGGHGNDILSGGYVEFDMNLGITYISDVSDWNNDYLHGGAGEDRFELADQKILWTGDHAVDAASEDEVNTSFRSLSGNIRWGHLYGT